MQRKNGRVLYLAILGFLLVTSPVLATPLCTGETSLQTYITQGSCQINDLIFSEFSYTPSPAGTLPSAASVMVTPISTAFNPGLEFQAVWQAFTPQALFFEIAFNVTVLPGGHRIDHASLGTGDLFAMFAGDSATVVENICAGSTVNGCTSGVPQLLYSVTVPGITQLGDHITFAPVNVVHVGNGIALTSSAGLASVLSLTEQFSQETEAPEPQNLLLVGTGLIAMVGIFGRRRMRSWQAR